MPGRIQLGYARYPTRQVCAMGDSLTHTLDLGTPPHWFWAELLAAKLAAIGCTVLARNHGKSGNTTSATSTNMQARMNLMLAHGVPDVAILFAGANDPGNGISTGQTQANLQSMIKWLKWGCAGQVADQTALPAGGKPGDRYVVQADGSATGGAAAATGQTVTIAGAGGGAQSVWEWRRGLAGEAGWGRIATAATPADRCSRIVVLSMHYQNFSGGFSGDTLSVPYAPYATLRTGAQQPAVTAEAVGNPGVVYSDLYTFLRNRIVAGTDTQGDHNWHYADGNQHWSRYGHELVAEHIAATVQAQAGWLAALTG